MSARRRAALALVAIVPVTYALKHYPGPGRWVFNNWLCSFGYEMFFMTLAFLFVPRRAAIPWIALWVCLVTIALEFAQLWKPPWLEALRATFPGRSLLGTTFSWWDLPAYPVGCGLGWMVLRALTAGPGEGASRGPLG